ncbi:MAG: iron-containing alcohol dehydrogenase [Halobacteriales archaeon]|nr:iron-containing alcohol dehydrogenase [Halobacteriales archaeon]
MKGDFDYSHSRTNVRFGRGRRDEVGEVAARHGDDALVVTTRNAMQEAGFLDDVLTSLEGAGVSAAVYDDADPNPTVSNVVDCVETAPDAELVVALGGGSPTDVAKAAVLSLASFDSVPSIEDVWEYASGEKRVEDAVPLVALPSTSGTGSHVDPWAVVTRADERAKVGFGGGALVPKEAVVDADIPDEMPADLTARTGFDAFCHLNEAYVARTANALTDANALRGMEIVNRNLRHSVEGSSEARDAMAVADTLAGFCETTSSTVATHGLAHAISAYEPDVAHGDALASVASEVAAYNVENGDDETKRRYGEIAETLGFPVADRKLDAPFVADAFDEFVAELRLDHSVGDLTDATPDELAENTVENMGFVLKNNPVEVEMEDLVGILEEAY